MPRLRLDPFSPSGVSIVTEQPAVRQQGSGYVVNKMTGLISAGSNVTITGQGTQESPYTIASTGGGGGGSTVWGDLTGDISNQLDLIAALGEKSDTDHTHSVESLNNLSTTGVSTGDLIQKKASGWGIVSFPDAEAVGAAPETYALGRVDHGSTASTPRPTGYYSIQWVGDVEPTNATANDTWLDVS